MRAQRRNVQPFSVQVEITSHCNLKCTMCPLTSDATLSSLRPGHMSTTNWAEVVEVAKQTRHIMISGFGEPLLHPHVYAFLQELDALGVTISMATNGAALNESNCCQLVGLAHLKHINVSIDSPDPEVYYHVRGGRLEQALRGLRTLMGMIDIPERVTVSSVVMRENISSLVQFPELLKQFGVKYYVLQGLMDYVQGATDNQIVGRDDLQLHIDALKKKCLENNIVLVFTQGERLDLELSNPEEAIRSYYSSSRGDATDSRQCMVPWEMPFIDKDGRVFPCCYASQEEVEILGDINQHSLGEIWQAAPYESFRRRLICGKSMPAICSSCMAAPRGPHPLGQYSTVIDLEKSRLRGSGHFELVVHNAGAKAWTADDKIRIGTVSPRDRESVLCNSTWLSCNRVGSFRQAIVEPGESAVFEFFIHAQGEPVSETFQLVVEGRLWLPGTTFVVEVDGPPA